MASNLNVADVRDRVKAEVHTAGDSLQGSLTNRDLTLPPAPDAPADLLKLITKHNTAAARWAKRDGALVATAGHLAEMLSDEAVGGTTIRQASGDFEVERYDCCQLHMSLIEARGRLLPELAKVLEARVETADAELVKLKTRTAAKLEKAGSGIGTEPGFVRAGADGADGAKITFAQRICRAPEVRAKIREVDQARADFHNARRLAGSIEADVLTVGQRLIESWRRLTAL